MNELEKLLSSQSWDEEEQYMDGVSLGYHESVYIGDVDLKQAYIELTTLTKERDLFQTKAIDYALIVEQFQKLLGVFTTTEALGKVAVLMREETEAERLLSKALGHLRTCSDPEGDDLYDEIAAAFGENKK